MKLLLGFVCMVIPPVWAQSTGEVTGLISDPSGAAVPSARLTLRDEDRKTAVTGESSTLGLFRLTGLNPGRYTLTISAGGFSEARVTGIVVEVNRITRADATLAVAGTAAAVEVVGQAQALDLESGTKGTVLNVERARDLPLQSRNPLALAALTPGVVVPLPATGADPTTRQGSDGTSASSGYILNGGLRGSGGFTEVVVDGISVTSQRDGVIQALPATDALQEFRVQSGGMGPEVGRTVGGVINYATRSGANELHGNLFWANRNTATTARRALPSVGDKPRNNYNQYGVTAGGPVSIPKLYRGRNRTFFLFSFDGSRWLRNNPTLDTVPAARVRTGDFSEIPQRIYDPLTSTNPAQRQTFPGNIIPSSRFNQIGKGMVEAFPRPSRPGVSANYDGRFRVVTPVDNYTGRIDHNLSDRQRLMGRVTWITSVNNQGWNLGDIDGRTGVSDIPSRGMAVNYSLSITPRLLYTSSGGYTWFHRTFIDPTGNGAGAGFFGFKVDPVPPTLATNIRPIVTWDIYRTIAANTVEDQKSETWQWNQSLAYVRDKHTLRAGTDLRWFIAGGALTVGAPNGSFGFSPLQTSQGTASTGYGAASALLGLPNTATFAQPPVLTARKAAPSLFIQDDYRITPELTLNLGLRFEYEGGLTEGKNRIGYFSASQTNPLLNLPGVFRYAAVDGEPNSIVESAFVLSPRIGFAWAPKFVKAFAVRDAFGAYNTPVPTVGPYGAAIGFEPTLQFVKPTATDPAVVLRESYSLPAASGQLGPAAYLGQSVSQILDRRLPPPRVYQWNIGFQKELLRDLVLEALYTGNRGSRLLGGFNIDLPEQAVVDEAIRRTNATGNPTAALSHLNELVPNPVAGKVPGTLGNAAVARNQATSRFPQFNGVSPTLNIRDSTYHALQATVQRRLSQGFSFLFSYTFSKVLTNLLNPQNPYDLRNSRGLPDADRPHVVSASFLYELPFGKGRPFAVEGWSSRILGGFHLNGIFRATSGPAVSVFQGAANGLGVGGARPDVIGDPATRSKAIRNLVAANGNVAWLDAASYSLVNGRFGTAPAADPRTRGPGFWQLDLGLTRNFRVTERVTARLNAQAFNALNHPNMVGLDVNLNSPTFGQLANVADPRIFQFGLEVRF